MNRVALVTGAAKGVGESITRRLHREGYRVVVGDIAEQGQALADSLDASGATACFVKLDVREKDAFKQALAAIDSRWGRVDVLVNNAGMSKIAPVLEISPEEFDRIVTLNMRSVFLGCQVFGAYFADRQYGRIVNIASLAGQNGGTATGAHYAASKGGVMTLTKVFAREFAARGVTVNSISPGPLDVPVVHETVPAEQLQNIKKLIPVGQLGSPDFIGDAVVLLASDAAASVTGACWDINGGLFMR